MAKQPSLLKRIEQLEKRNQRVEADKAWETSWARRIAIAILTYATISVYLRVVVGINPWINAFVPTLGFLLSTLTISFLKKRWVTQRVAPKR